MNVVLGLKAHSGWAAAVVVGQRGNDFVIVDRQRVELVEERWAKQPYHAAENLKPEPAREKVLRGIAEAQRLAVQELGTLLKTQAERKNKVVACAVLLGAPMPDWSIDEILAVHFRMHKAEGVLFRDALMKAATVCKLTSHGIPEKQLFRDAGKTLRESEAKLTQRLLDLGKQVGPPWGKDQKEAALAAMIALREQ